MKSNLCLSNMHLVMAKFSICKLTDSKSSVQTFKINTSKLWCLFNTSVDLYCIYKVIQ